MANTNYAQLLATLKGLTAGLKQENKDAIKEGWAKLGLVEHRARLLTLREPSISFEEAKGLIYMAMDLVSAEGDYQENVLVQAVELSKGLSEPEFRAKILELAKASGNFDKVTSLAGAFLQGL
jgi:hypothetical protein